MTGGKLIHFLVKNVNFKLSYFFQFAVELHKTSHFFVKSGMTNLFMDPIFHLIKN